jgi:hypothetical protein
MDTRQEGVVQEENHDGQVLCVYYVNGFNGVETGLLVPVLRRIPWMCRLRAQL